jgi:hypothetical protein
MVVSSTERLPRDTLESDHDGGEEAGDEEEEEPMIQMIV